MRWSGTPPVSGFQRYIRFHGEGGCNISAAGHKQESGGTYFAGALLCDNTRIRPAELSHAGNKDVNRREERAKSQ